MPQGIHEEALRALVEGGAVRDTLVSHQEDKWTLAIRLGGAGSRWQPLVGGTLAPRNATHLGQPDGGRTICRCGGVARILCGAVTGDSFNASCSIPTTSGPSSLIQVP
ncbi:hypothetical protein [Pseudomonas sp.]|uniref:hypothetical protein n=1 Tax=Pseudomonas sp. TaxID=306 RepID=UPI003C75D9BC